MSLAVSSKIRRLCLNNRSSSAINSLSGMRLLVRRLEESVHYTQEDFSRCAILCENPFMLRAASARMDYGVSKIKYLTIHSEHNRRAPIDFHTVSIPKWHFS